MKKQLTEEEYINHLKEIGLTDEEIIGAVEGAFKRKKR